MSMNLHIAGERNATVNVRGTQKTIVDRVDFDLFQTPTKVSYEIFNLESVEAQVAAYAAWVKSLDVELEEVYEDYDEYLDAAFNGPSPSHKISFVDPAEKHIKALQEFISMCSDEEYTVKFYVM